MTLQYSYSCHSIVCRPFGKIVINRCRQITYGLSTSNTAAHTCSIYDVRSTKQRKSISAIRWAQSDVEALMKRVETVVADARPYRCVRRRVGERHRTAGGAHVRACARGRRERKYDGRSRTPRTFYSLTVGSKTIYHARGLNAARNRSVRLN